MITGYAVTRVIDGDTIEVEIDGELKLVRYIGINTPEVDSPYTREEPYGPAATAANKALVEGRRVRLEKDVSETDSLDRLLRYVYVDDLFVNAEMVRLGLARSIAYPPDTLHQGELDQLESQARAEGRGLWAESAAGDQAGLFLEIVSVSSPVKAGDKAALTASTSPGANCQITVNYKSGPSKAKGLDPQTAGSDGRVTWSWTVGSKTTPGQWKITVKAALNGESLTQTTVFTVR